MTQLDLQQRLEKAEAERRIKACVNAFDGIPTERIEGKDLGQILAGELRLHGAGPRTDDGFGFDFSGGVCQLLAEAYADQFRESGAVNYLELLFNHTEIGPLTITMQRVQGLTPAQKLAQAEAERDALQQQVNALAAEALYLKDEIVQHSQSTHFCKVCGEDDPCVNDDVCWALTHETPATDAIKRQWMAEGLEEYGNLTVAIGREQKDLDIDYAGRQALLYAAQLRQPEEKGQ